MHPSISHETWRHSLWTSPFTALLCPEILKQSFVQKDYIYNSISSFNAIITSCNRKKKKSISTHHFWNFKKSFRPKNFKIISPEKKKSSVLMFYACFRTVVTIRKNLQKIQYNNFSRNLNTSFFVHFVPCSYRNHGNILLIESWDSLMFYVICLSYFIWKMFTSDSPLQKKYFIGHWLDGSNNSLASFNNCKLLNLLIWRNIPGSLSG